MLTILCIWSIISSLNFSKDLFDVNKKSTYNLSDFCSNLKTNPVISIVFCICLFSLAGIPPLIGFYAKFNVFHSAINCGYINIAIFVILTSVISAFYYLRIIKSIYFENTLKNR